MTGTSDPSGVASTADATRRRRTLGDIFRLIAPYWSGDRSRQARSATVLFLALTLGQVGLTIWGNYWNRALFDALEQRTAQGVLVQVGVFVLIFTISIAVTAAHLMVKRWLQRDWREWLTERLVGHWMEGGRQYRLAFADGEHDNPDQRIAEDIRITTESAIALVHSLVYSVLTLVLFTDILWTVSGSIRLPGGVEVSGYMVPLAFAYAIVGGALGWLFGKPLVRTTNVLQSAEATFRFGLSRARDHAEAIALLHAEPLERAGSSARFRDVVRAWDRQSLAFLGVVAFGTAYGALLPVFPILIAAPRYIAGAMTLGMLMQAAQAFQGLTSSLSWPVNNLGEIAHWRASANRVISLHEDLGRLDAASRHPTQPSIDCRLEGTGTIRVEGLCIAEVTGQVLLERLDLEVRRGEHVLVRGDSTVTVAFFKVLAGLWPWGRGRVLLPEEPTLFLPQRPLLPQGTLRAALSYPRPPDAFDTAEIRRLLERVELAWLVSRLDDEDNWEQSLSMRAQQRLDFARALLHRPAWVIMEEATGAFDGDRERALLGTLRAELPDAAWITISFHSGLEEIHDRTIELVRLQEQRFLFLGRRPNGNGH